MIQSRRNIGLEVIKRWLFGEDLSPGQPVAQPAPAAPRRISRADLEARYHELVREVDARDFRVLREMTERAGFRITERPRAKDDAATLPLSVWVVSREAPYYPMRHNLMIGLHYMDDDFVRREVSRLEKSLAETLEPPMLAKEISPALKNEAEAQAWLALHLNRENLGRRALTKEGRPADGA